MNNGKNPCKQAAGRAGARRLQSRKRNWSPPTAVRCGPAAFLWPSPASGSTAMISPPVRWKQGAEYVVVNHPGARCAGGKGRPLPGQLPRHDGDGRKLPQPVPPKVVGVTGSVGKTTTKQMTYAAIAGFGNTIKTEGNQNNELGMPRT